MSNEIDRRIVDMQFNNAQFESGVNQSIGTLDRLKNALSFKGVSKGIEQVSFGTLNNGINTVSKGFSALQTIATGALIKIGFAAVDAGKKLFNALFVQQPKAGWSKYEQITSSVQTILAATKELGQTMESVTGYVNKLNWYTDETSYSLTDMTSNIAKFTSAGIELDSATVAMMGIANASALAGSGVQSASHAMAGFSKAMAAGSMGTRQWMWIETAKMDTMSFKNELIAAAVAVGTLKKVTSGTHAGEYITTSVGGTKKGKYVTAESIRENLSSGWMNKDVMETALNTYGRFANLMSDFYVLMGDGATYTTNELLTLVDEYAKGSLDIQKLSKKTGVSVETLTENFEDLKKEGISGIDESGNLIYTIGRNAFAAAQEAITLKQAWEALTDALSTGWMKTWQLIFGNYEEAKKLWTNLANWLYDLFAEGGNVRNAILDEWHFSESGGYQDFVESLYNIMDAVTSVRDLFKEVFDQYLPSISADNLIDWTSKLLSYTTNLSSYMEKVREAFAYVAKITGRSVEEDTGETETFDKVSQQGALATYVDQLLGREGYEKRLAENLVAVNKKSPLMQEWADYVNAANFTSARAFINWNYSDIEARDHALAMVDDAESKYFARLEKFEDDWQKTYEKEYDKLEAWQKEHPFISPDVYWEEIGHSELVEQHREVTRSHRDPLMNNNDYSSIMDLYDALDGLNSILSIVKETATSAWGALKQIFSPAKILVDDIVKLFGALGRRLVEIGDKLVGEGKISAFFDDLTDKAGGPVEKLVDFLHRFLEALTALIDPEVSSGTHEFAETLKQLFGGVWKSAKDFVQSVAPVLTSIWNVISSIVKGLAEAITGFVGQINFAGIVPKLKAVLDIGIGTLLFSFLKKLNVFGKEVKEKGLMAMIKEAIFGKKDEDKEGGTLTKITEMLDNFTTKLSDSLAKILNIEAFKTFATSVLMIAGALLLMAMIPADKLAQVAIMFGSVIGSFILIINILKDFKAVKDPVLKKGLDVKGILALGAAIAALATAIFVIALSLVVLALIPKEALEKALAGLTGILLLVGITLAAMFYIVNNSGVTSSQIIALAIAFLALAPAILAMAVAIGVIAVSLALLSLIPADKLLSAASAIGIVLAVMGILLYVLSQNALGVMAAAAAFLMLAPAVAVLALSLGLLALIPAERLLTGILALTALTTILGILMYGLSTNALGILGVAAAFLILAPALVVMSLALIMLSLVPFAKLLGGLVIFAAMLAVISAAAIVTSVMIGPLFALGGALILIGAGTILLGAGLVLVSTAISILIAGVAYGISLIIDSIANLISVIVGPFEGIGKSVTKFKERLVNGLKNILPKLKEVGKELWDKLVNAWDSIDFKAIGQNIVNGIKNGLSKCWEGIKSAGKWLWNTLTSGFNAAGGISSPSKVMMEEMKWVVAGMEIGADKNERSIREVGAGMADALLGATGDALQDYDSFAPNLTPVLDLSNVSGSAGMSFGATLTPNSMRSLASVSADISNQRDSMNDYINAAVESALNGMKDELTFIVPLEIDGKQFAKATAKHTKDAQDTLDYYSLRRLGYA